jgi:hypothetical protein
VAPLADLNDWGNYATGDPPSNAEALLDAASGLVRTYCGWSISEEIVDGAVFDSDGSKLLLLPTLHLTVVTQVLVDGTEVTDFTWSQMGALAREGCWPAGFRRITVSFTHGWNPVQAEVKAMVVGLVSRVSTTPANLEQKTVGAVTYRYTEAGASMVLGSAEQRVLDRYRLP